MVPLKDNADLECFLVTKHSWKGKYKRILSIGSIGVSTYNPDKFDITNRWTYSDIVAVVPNKAVKSIFGKLPLGCVWCVDWLTIFCRYRCHMNSHWLWRKTGNLTTSNYRRNSGTTSLRRYCDTTRSLRINRKPFRLVLKCGVVGRGRGILLRARRHLFHFIPEIPSVQTSLVWYQSPNCVGSHPMFRGSIGSHYEFSASKLQLQRHKWSYW